MRLLSASLFLAPVLALATVAHADVTYTSQAAYLAAVGPQNTITFNGQAAGYFTNPGNPYTTGGVIFSNTTNSAQFITDPAAYYGSSYPSDYFETDYGTGNIDNVIVTLPYAVTSVSFNYGGLFAAGDTFQVVLGDGFATTILTTQSITGTNSLDFVGFTSTTPFSTFTITTPDAPNYNAFDNFSYGAAAPATPEPSSLMLLGTGLAGVAGAVRRRLKA